MAYELHRVQSPPVIFTVIRLLLAFSRDFSYSSAVVDKISSDMMNF